MPMRMTRDARDAITRARDTARERGSRTVEAEHLMLALADRPADAAGTVLGDAGLCRDALLDALDAEEARSLAAAGVARGAFDLPPPRPAPSGPRWGASAKLAIERGHRTAAARRDRRLVTGHLLVGLLAARRGTVPRALEVAGVDAAALADQAEAALPEGVVG